MTGATDAAGQSASEGWWRKPDLSQTSGMHWHADPDIAEEYISRDKQRQTIPWVRVTDS